MEIMAGTKRSRPVGNAREEVKMKVSENNNAPIQLDAYVKQAQQRGPQPEHVRQAAVAAKVPNDKVQLSEEAREILQASQIAGNQSDVRNDKVRQVKMEIESGTYRVVGTRVATDMLKESFENNLLLQKINTRA
jgi:flagellar biosynthesis anti-sigma factor FlgM